MRLPINIIPNDIIEQYNLLLLVVNGSIYIEIQKGMYDYLKLAKLHTIALESTFFYTVTPLLHSLLVYGDIHIAPSPSPLSLMMLVLNPKIFSIQITSTMHFAISTQSRQIPLAPFTVA